MTTPMPVFRIPYDIRLRHGAGAYFAIESSDRNPSLDPSSAVHALEPGTYRVKVHYQGPHDSGERVTLHFDGANILHTPTLNGTSRASSGTATVIVKDGEIGELRVFSTPRSSELTDKSGVASISVMPSQKRP